MALKFLNKKGWHTGSLRNIENVWKAEQKNNAEQTKLEELRKQIQEERERSEFRQLQEQAGLVPRQERLDFLYESGLAVGKGSEGFKALEAPATAAVAVSLAPADASSSKAAVPGALFEEDKPKSANDTWRKLHSDPLLLIRQREQEALARIKNNPVQMAMIRKSAEAEKNKKDDKAKREKKRHKRKHHHKTKSERTSDLENTSESEEDRRKGNRSDTQKHGRRKHSSKNSSDDEEERRNRDRLTADRHKDKSSNNEKHYSRPRSDSRYEEDGRKSGRSTSEHHSQYNNSRHPSRVPDRDEERSKHGPSTSDKNKEPQLRNQQGPGYNRRKGVPKMTEEEREARLREMQVDAEVHEEQRWKRIKKAAEVDAQEAAEASSRRGKNFLDEAQKSIYGAEKGGSSTIEESVRRRAYYSQGGRAAHESNAFRR